MQLLKLTLTFNCFVCRRTQFQSDEPTTQRGHEFGSTLHTYHFSPVNHNSDSNNDEFHSGDERRDPALLSRRLRRSPSPFAHQGQPFPNAPTTLSPPLSRGSVGSRSSNSQHHHNQHHKHHRHGGDHSPSSHYAQRPRTPSPTPYANSSRPAHSHTSNAPARAFDASGSGLQPAPQPPPPLQGVAQASRQSSYIVSIYILTLAPLRHAFGRLPLPFLMPLCSPVLHRWRFDSNPMTRLMCCVLCVCARVVCILSDHSHRHKQLVEHRTHFHMLCVYSLLGVNLIPLLPFNVTNSICVANISYQFASRVISKPGWMLPSDQ